MSSIKNTATKSRASSIEALEQRIAPSTLSFVNPTTATYTDLDGDKVTVKFSKGILSAANVSSVLVLASTGATDQLQEIDLTVGGLAAPTAGIGIAVTVKAAPATGDGLANVGYINATNIDLGAVSIKGDLGAITAGTTTVTSPSAIKSLSVQSIGQFGTSTGATSLESDITGALGGLTVKGDVTAAFINVTGGASGKIGSISIGGSLIGGSMASAGLIQTTGDIGSVKIGGNIEGNSGLDSGQLSSGGKLGNVTVGISVEGGSNTGAGEITSTGNMGSVKIGHDLVGGTGVSTGLIDCDSMLLSATIGGSIWGGTALDSGQIETDGSMGAIKIAGDIHGGSVSGTTSLFCSGFISSGHRIASVTIGGSIYAGFNTGTGILAQDGAIQAGEDIGSVTVKGSLVGNDTRSVVISADGPATHTAKADLAIGSVTVGGRVDQANILAGYANTLFPVADNASAQIGSIKVSGDWIASNLIAGIENLGTDGMAGGTGTAADNVNYGDMHDLPIGGTLPALESKIGSITIAGEVLGTIGGTDHFGFSAEQFGSIHIGGAAIKLTGGPGDTLRPVGTTGDVDVSEVGEQVV